MPATIERPPQHSADFPILYSFRRCPYAIRARLAFRVSGIDVALREVLLRDKPAALLRSSAKGTVPVLQCADGRVIDESLDIILWALGRNDPGDWLLSAEPEPYRRELHSLIVCNDGPFKAALDRYKYADRYPQFSVAHYRDQAEGFIAEWDRRLSERRYLVADTPSVADMAIVPFVRQFALVDKQWFDQTSYTRVQGWLASWLESDLFNSVMAKYPVWTEGDTPIRF